MAEWVILYVLNLHYCAQPQGKSACQPVHAVYTFSDAMDCLNVRNDLINYYDSFPYIIVDKWQTKCVAKATDEKHGFESAEAATQYGDARLTRAQELLDKLSNTYNR